MNENLLGKCGFYCGCCPTYIKGGCKGCMDEHSDGDCHTRDCVLKQGIACCGACEQFPCDTIMTKPHTTVLDKDWLWWKKKSNKLIIHFGEVETAISVMREVAAWGREQGYRVWPDEWLTAEELITPNAQPENFCIGTIDGELACAFILQWADSEYWPEAPKYEAAYLHKFCVRRKFAGMGMTRLVTEAIRAECRKHGIRYIRLDTGLDENVVRNIYLNAGYKIVNIIDYPDGRSMALYEMEI